MYIPNSFQKAQRKEIRRCFFGVDQLITKCVFTPIRRYFGDLATGLIYNRGWCETYSAYLVFIGLIPQGSACIDAVSALEPQTKITFLVICGALKNLEVGDVIEI